MTRIEFILSLFLGLFGFRAKPQWRIYSEAEIADIQYKAAMLEQPPYWKCPNEVSCGCMSKGQHLWHLEHKLSMEGKTQVVESPSPPVLLAGLCGDICDCPWVWIPELKAWCHSPDCHTTKRILRHLALSGYTLRKL